MREDENEIMVRERVYEYSVIYTFKMNLIELEI